MSISSSTHNHFMQYVCLAQSLFESTSADARFAIVVLGQPTELFEWGFVIVNGHNESLLAAAGKLNGWLSDPAWVLENTPGYVGPPLFLAVAERLDDITISVISCLLDTTARHMLTRLPAGQSLETLPLVDPWPSHLPTLVAVPTVLRLLQSSSSFGFDENVSAIIERLEQS
jgi:hypothetical protein